MDQEIQVKDFSSLVFFNVDEIGITNLNKILIMKLSITFKISYSEEVTFKISYSEEVDSY